MNTGQRVVLTGAGGVGGGLATYGVGWLVGDYWAGLAVLVPLFYLLGRAEGRASGRRARLDDDFWDVEVIPKKRREFRRWGK